MNITLFETHLDDATIAPSIGGRSPEMTEEIEIESEESGRSRRFPLGLLLLAGIGAVVVARRLRGGDDGEGIDVEIEADAEPISAE